MESKVFKLLHKGNKKHFADLQEKTEGGGGGWMDGWMRLTLAEE